MSGGNLAVLEHGVCGGAQRWLRLDDQRVEPGTGALLPPQPGSAAMGVAVIWTAMPVLGLAVRQPQILISFLEVVSELYCLISTLIS